MNTASTGRVMISAVHLDCAAVAIHVTGPNPVGKAVIRSVLLAFLRRHIQDSVGTQELFAAAPKACVGEIDVSVVLEDHFARKDPRCPPSNRGPARNSRLRPE